MSVNFWATMRAIASLAPPAACGTTTVPGLLGYLSWASAAVQDREKKLKANKARRVAVRGKVMGRLLERTVEIMV
jgi:hypothetical protein